jgi:CRP-like cAMP-binding protein
VAEFDERREREAETAMAQAYADALPSGDPIPAGWKGPPRCATCAIRSRGLFADLSAEDFALIRKTIHEVHLDAGGVLYPAGAAPEYLYTIRGGLVKLVQYLPCGTERIVRLLKPGDSVGLEAVLGLPYRHEAVALEPLTACRIPVEVVRQLDRQTPLLGRELFARWQRALEETDGWLTELGTGTALQRVARLLLRLAGDDEGTARYLPCREDLAAMIGTTAESASRAVASLKRSGSIRQLSPQRARVDVPRLRQFLER